MTNIYHSVLYTGVTSNLIQRVYQHKNKVKLTGFSARYNLTKLVWYKELPKITDAIILEKQIKGLTRKKKIILINTMNPYWNDVSRMW